MRHSRTDDALNRRCYDCRIFSLFFPLLSFTSSSDGNCLFRAFADQLHGCPHEHPSLRTLAVDFMAQHPDDFAPFMEDDELFEDYLSRMRRDKVWGGQQELVALSRAIACDVCVHTPSSCYRMLSPREEGKKALPPPRLLHISYHDGCHFNSIRDAEDVGGKGPPAPLRSPCGVARPSAAAFSSSGEGGGGAKGPPTPPPEAPSSPRRLGSCEQEEEQGEEEEEEQLEEGGTGVDASEKGDGVPASSSASEAAAGMAGGREPSWPQGAEGSGASSSASGPAPGLAGEDAGQRGSERDAAGVGEGRREAPEEAAGRGHGDPDDPSPSISSAAAADRRDSGEGTSASASSGGLGGAEAAEPDQVAGRGKPRKGVAAAVHVPVGRNRPCPCGSKEKAKNCCKKKGGKGGCGPGSPRSWRGDQAAVNGGTPGHGPDAARGALPTAAHAASPGPSMKVLIV